MEEETLDSALQKLKEDKIAIKIKVPKAPLPDQEIEIDTEHYNLVLGANDLGVWLEKLTKKTL